MCPINEITKHTFELDLPGIMHYNFESGRLLFLRNNKLYFLDGTIADCIVV